MKEIDDRSFENGKQWGLIHVLSAIIPHMEGDQKELARHVRERAETLMKIEQICDFLEIDFNENGYLPDLLNDVLKEIDGRMIVD